MTQQTQDAQDALARAIDYLGAVEVSAPLEPTALYQGRRYAYREHPAAHYYIVDEDELRHLGSAIIEEQPDAYALWVSSAGVAMPPWWSPERRYAVKRARGIAIDLLPAQQAYLAKGLCWCGCGQAIPERQRIIAASRGVIARYVDKRHRARAAKRRGRDKKASESA